MNLAEYVAKHAVRGACMCGKCIDAPVNANEKQPAGHTVDLTFFKVAASGGDKEAFLAKVREEYPQWLDGKEHGYMEMGSDMGDQGIALMTIGLGHLLGVWKALAPETLMPFLPGEMKKKMAGAGYVACQVQEMVVTARDIGVEPDEECK
jgi:hypothetical protein